MYHELDKTYLGKNVTTLSTSSEFIFHLGMCSMQYVENAAATDSFQLNSKTETTAKVRIKNRKYNQSKFKRYKHFP